MGQKDLYESDFYEDKVRFADVFNGVLFEGNEVVKPEELEEIDSVQVSLQNRKTGKKVICDKIRKWKGKYVSIMVLENQSYVDYGMVFRVMETEAIGYGKQRKERFLAKRRVKEKFGSEEYLSQMKKGDKFTPIITLVLYLGKDKMWDGETSLHGMLELEEELRPYVNDFKLNLFDYHDYENFDMFKTENRLLFEMLSCGKDKKKMQQLLREEKEYSEVDEESAKAIFGILGVGLNLEKIRKQDKDGRERYDMCQAIEDMRRDERQEGRREGALDMALKNVKNLMKNQKVTCEEAMNMMGISKKMQKKIETLV